ncbi:MAG: hypothetical protein ACXW5U_09830 [Thermoanaerobaculia bacterium]
MSLIGHIWTVALNLFSIVVVIAMFDVAETRFETIVVAGLALIYLTVVSSHMAIGRMNVESARANLAQFARLCRLLNDSEADYYEEAVTENKREIAKATVRFHINFVFNGLIWFIALFKLVTTSLA